MTITVPPSSTDAEIDSAVNAAIKATQPFMDMVADQKAYDDPFDAATNPDGTAHGTQNGQNAVWTTGP